MRRFLHLLVLTAVLGAVLLRPAFPATDPIAEPTGEELVDWRKLIIDVPPRWFSVVGAVDEQKSLAAPTGGGLIEWRELTINVPPRWFRVVGSADEQMSFGTKLGDLMVVVSLGAVESVRNATTMNASLGAMYASFKDSPDHSDVTLVRNSEVTLLGEENCPYLTFVSGEKRSIVFTPPGQGEGYTVTVQLPADAPAEIQPFTLEFLANVQRTSDWKAQEEAISKDRLVAFNAPITLPPVKSAPFVEINKLTQSQWDGAVAAAMESVRLIQGAMTPAEQAAFERRWAPLRTMPSRELVEYVNALNPLLAQFLSLRTGVQATAARVEKAMVEAGWAAELDAEVLTRQYLSLASRYRNLLLSQQRKLDQVAKNIADLGDPPDGQAMMAEGQQAYQRAKDYLRGLMDSEEGLEGVWVGFVEWEEGVPFLKAVKQEPFLFVVYNTAAEQAEPDYRALYLDAGEDEETPDLYVDEVPLKDLGLIERFTKASIDAPLEEGGRFYAQRQVGETLPVFPGASLEAFERALAEEAESVRKENQRLASRSVSVNKQGGPEDTIKIVANTVVLGISENVRDDARRHYRMRPAFLQTARQWLQARKWGADIEEDLGLFQEMLSTGGGAAVALTEKSQQAREDKAKKQQQEEKERAQEQAKSDGPIPLHVVDDKTPEERRIIDTEAVTMHQINIDIIRRHMERDRAELGNEKDPTRRAELDRRILHATADIQSEQDRIASLKTGTVVHTRSVFDDYAHAQFIQKIGQEQRKMEAVQKATETAYRLVETLPEEEARKLRKLADQNLTPDLMANLDDTRAREVVNKLHTITSNYWQAEKDKAGVNEAWADASLQTAMSIKGKADTALQYASMVGGKHVYTMYKGATGYIDGGVKEAVLSVADSYSKTTGAVSAAVRGYEAGGAKEAFLRVSGSYNDAAMAAVEFYRGFEEAGADGDLFKALSNASWRTAKSVAIDKGTQFLMGKVADRYNNGPKAEAQRRAARAQKKGVKLSKKPRSTTDDDSTTTAQKTAKPKRHGSSDDDFNRPLTDTEVKAYRTQVTDARVRVRSLQKTHEKLQKARKAGAPPSQIKKILRELDDRAAKVHASAQAKIMMKNLQASPKNAEVCKRFVNSMDRVHNRTQKRFHEEMGELGYNKQDLQPIRNVGAGKSVNMDYDIAIKQQPWVKGGKLNPWLTKKGKPVSVEAWQLEAQEVWNKVYAEETGQSAADSFETVTFSQHHEAYSDLDIIKKGGGGILEANKKFAEQTGDVSKWKATDLRDDPKFKNFGKVRKYVEIARGTAKDSKKKLLKLMDENKPKPGTKAYPHWEKQRQYWGNLTRVMEDMGSMKVSPMDADRKIRLITGGKSLIEVNQDMGDLLAAAIMLKK